MFRVSAILCATATIASAGTLDAPVVGGTQVPAGKWPDAVAVLGSQGTCSGTLIAPNVVLTAGHCINIKPAQVIANTVDFAAHDGQVAGVVKTIAYPSWQSSYDVSVIVLDRNIDGVKPRKVGTSCTFDGFAAGDAVHLVGFGLTAEDGSGANTLLNEAMTSIVDPTCSGGRGCNASVAPGGEFVAGGNGTDSCFGDSGGPVYLDTARGDVVIGAVSRGIDGASRPCGGGGIYVRTDKLIQWIESTTGQTIAKDDCSAGDGDPRQGPAVDGSSADLGGCSAAKDTELAVGLFVLILALRKPRFSDGTFSVCPPSRNRAA